jgi:hypothetical protein
LKPRSFGSKQCSKKGIANSLLNTSVQQTMHCRTAAQRRCPVAEGESADFDRLLSAVRTLEPLIREHADAAAQQRHLSPPVVTALAEAGIFRMYTPRAFGGFEVDPLTFFGVVEALAGIDASTGWCVFIAGGNPLLGAYLADQAAAEVFGRDPLVVTAGVVFPFGKAEVCDGGYRVSGRWAYACGCQHCTWIFCACQVVEVDHMRLTAEEAPKVRLFFVSTRQVTIVDTWEVSGLAGTGSHDVVFEHVFVPTAFTRPFGPGMEPQGTHYQSPLYRYVLYQQHRTSPKPACRRQGPYEKPSGETMPLMKNNCGRRCCPSKSRTRANCTTGVTAWIVHSTVFSYSTETKVASLRGNHGSGGRSPQGVRSRHVGDTLCHVPWHSGGPGTCGIL